MSARGWISALALVPMLFLLFGQETQAGKADVLEVRLEQDASGNYTAAVTLKHSDQGWKHFANRWEILDLEGNLLATRVLRHPHDEQPFTRALDDIEIPDDVDQVRVRGHDLKHGYGGVDQVVDVLRSTPDSTLDSPLDKEPSIPQV
jgi:hypothetical protein